MLLHSAVPAQAGQDDILSAEASTGSDAPPPPPPPDCSWTSSLPSTGEIARWRSFWNRIDGGEYSDDVVVFTDNGTLRQTITSSHKTYVRQVRVCTDPNHPDNGNERWDLVGPPNPTVYWDELSERVTRNVPAPDPEFGFTMVRGQPVEITINVGLWLAVSNSADVVARAEPAPGVWAESRAALSRIEFDPGNGDQVVRCDGPGVVLPDDMRGETPQGPCGYTYQTVDDLGDRTVIMRATWTVMNMTSSGATEPRPDIVTETLIPVTVVEVQTVGTG